jgi:hypothetical protein
MQSNSTPDLSTDNLIWTRLPNDEFAWLKPSTDAAESDDALYTVTDRGRRALAMDALFGHGWPTVAEAQRG